jgi:hypothetical protein
LIIANLAAVGTQFSAFFLIDSSVFLGVRYPEHSDKCENQQSASKQYSCHTYILQGLKFGTATGVPLYRTPGGDTLESRRAPKRRSRQIRLTGFGTPAKN